MTVPHHATRTVRLPESWENAPRDVQVNYYNYLAKRLIYSTDIYIGERLAYRTNAIACRGDDLAPHQPVIGVFGDDFVHGDLSGSFVDDIRIGPCRALNVGIENLPLKSAVDRLNELTAAVPMAAAVFAPPRRELIPEVNRVTGQLQGDWEADWETEFARIKGPAITVILTKGRNAPAVPGEDATPILDRFDRFVEDLCRRKAIPLLIPGEGEGEGGLAGLGRMLGLGAKARPGQDPVAALIEQRLAKPVLAFLKTHPQAAGPGPATAPHPAAGAHGPDDVGRNYPLW
jgi:hypothetical protein